MPPKLPPRIIRKPVLPIKPTPATLRPAKPTSPPKAAARPASKPNRAHSAEHISKAVRLTTPRPYQPPRKWEQIFAIWLYSLPKSIYFAFLATASLVFVRDTLVSMDTVNGSSMAPSLSPDAHETGKQDWVLIQRFMPSKDLKRGDVVTFWKPHRPGEISIKRVVGLQGDTVYPHRGYAVEKEWGKRIALMDGLPEADADSDVDGEREVGKVVVPHNHIWVEGDNWWKSYDSNDIGPISMSLLDGKAIRVWRNWWFRSIGDKRKEVKSRVVEGESELPAVLL